MRNNIYCEYCGGSDGDHDPACPAAIYEDLTKGEPKDEKPLDFDPGRANMIFTSGDPDPIKLEDKDRRFGVVGHLEATFERTPDLDKLMGLDEEVEVDEAKIEGILMRRKEVMKTHGAGAQIVAPYKPNRKQRRCQEHAKKAAKSKSNKKRRW